jgi:hypothetical protein
MADRPLTAAAQGEVQSLLQERRKIDAIKVLRAHTGLGLKEAKDAADAMERDLGLVTSSPFENARGFGCVVALIVVALMAWLAYRWLIAPGQ